MFLFDQIPNLGKNRYRFFVGRMEFIVDIWWNGPRVVAWRLVHLILRGKVVMLHSALFCRGPFRGGNVVGIINILPGYCWDSLLVSKQEIKKDRPHWTV